MDNNINIRVLIADDHLLFRTALISLLETDYFINIIGEAANGKELIEQYKELNPDVVLTDISMPEMNGIEAAKKIKQYDKDTRILILSMYERESLVYQCFKAGAIGFLSKNIIKGELLFAIKKVYNGEYYFGNKYSNNKLQKLFDKFKEMDRSTNINSDLILTGKERVIIKMISEGKTSDEIASHLHVSKRTVDSHRTNLMHKLNLKSLAELIRFAIFYCGEDRYISYSG